MVAAPLTTGGCAFISDQIKAIQGNTREKALRAYRDGDYGAARDRFFDLRECAKGQKNSEDAAVCEDVDAGIQETIRSNLEKARESIAKRNNYVQALPYYRLALKYMDASHPERKKTEEEMKMVQENLMSFGKEYDGLLDKFKNRLGKEDFSEDAWKELKNTIERLDFLRSALRKQDENLSTLALGYSRKYYYRKEHDKAYYLAEWADAFSKFQKPLSDEGLQWIATVRYVHGRKKGDGQNGDAKKEVKSAKPKIVVRPSVKKEIPLSPQNEPKLTMPTSAPEVDNVPAMEAEALKAVESVLAKVRGDFADGRVFEALVGIDQAIKDLSKNPHAGKLVEQRNQLEPDRAKQIAGLLEEANRYLLQRDAESRPKALELYEKVLVLDPRNSESEEKRNLLESLKRGNGK